MSQPDATFEARARRAQEKLVEQVIDHPDVTLVDIGYDLENPASPEHIVLRAHVRRPVTKSALGLPDEIDGIPVVLIAGDYQEESGASG
jgi:hypothetical protein